MSLIPSASRVLLLAAVSLVAAPALAFQPTGNPAADQFLANAEAGGWEAVTIGQVTGDDQEIVLQNVAAPITVDMTPPAPEPQSPGEAAEAEKQPAPQPVSETINLAVDRITLTGPGLDANGRRTFTSVVYNGFVMASPESRTTVRLGRTEGVTLLNPEQIAGATKGPGTTVTLFNRLTAEDTVVSPDGGVPVTVRDMRMENSAFTDSFPTASKVSATGIQVPTEALEPDVRARLKSIGYDTLSFGFDASWNWDAATGILNLPSLAVSGASMGRLDFSAVVGGVTDENVRAMQSGDPQTTMGLLQNMTVKSAKLRFDNQSIVERLIEYSAKDQGVTRDVLVGQLTAALPMLLQPVQNAAFSAEVSKAVGEFLRQPRSLTISVAPQNPTPFFQILGLAAMAPQTIPQALQLTVTANE